VYNLRIIHVLLIRDQIMSSSHKKFPLYLQDSFGAEESLVELADQRENYIFNSLFRIEQHMDQYHAYKYAENNWLTKDISTLTAADFITLAKEINRIAGRSLMAVKDENGAAGEYLRHAINLPVNTGLEGETFEDSVTFSQHNYAILFQTHGKKTAELYYEFCHLLELEYRPSTELEAEKSIAAWAEIVTNYSDTPAAKAYALVKTIVNPRLVPKQMDIFSRLLVAHIAAKKDPITLAAFILSQLPTVHAFSHANSRSSRIFMNTVLMMSGHDSIYIPAVKADDYYLCLKEYRGGNIKPLKNLLEECSKLHSATPSLTSNFFPRYFSLDASLSLKSHELEYAYLLPPVIQDYFPASHDTQINAAFYLQRALKYVGTNLKVAKFYYTAAQRMANTEKLNPELAARIQTNRTPLDLQNKPIPKFKSLYMIAPHETARMSAKRNQEDGLVAYLTGQRYAVVIIDKQKNVSMTVIDRTDSLGFILDEVSAMKVKTGNFTIDVIKDFSATTAGALTDLKVIQNYLANTFNNTVKNSKGTTDVRTTKTSALMIIAGKLQTPARDHIQKRIPFSVFNIRYSPPDPASAVLKEWVAYEGSKSFQARLTERMLVSDSTPANKNTQPTLVFNEEWTGNFPELSAKVNQFFAAACGKTSEAVMVELKKILPPRPQVWLEEVVRQTMMHERYSRKCLYFRLNGFFNKPNTPTMPQNAIAAITAYAESEELAGFRFYKALQG
jgi:hypothetical protein